MMNKPKREAKPSRPTDESLEAYKAWIRDISRRLTTSKVEINLSEEWVKSWKEQSKR